MPLRQTVFNFFCSASRMTPLRSAKSIEAPHGPYAIQPLKMEDFKEIKNIFYDTFDLCDDADFFRAWKHRNRQSSMGLYYNSTLIGFGLVVETRLWFLAVSAPFRGGGTGTKLLMAILNTMPSCHLTPVNDPRIIAWYERHGFRITQYFEFKNIKIPTVMMTWLAPTLSGCTTPISECVSTDCISADDATSQISMMSD